MCTMKRRCQNSFVVLICVNMFPPIFLAPKNSRLSACPGRSGGFAEKSQETAKEALGQLFEGKKASPRGG